MALMAHARKATKNDEKASSPTPTPPGIPAGLVLCGGNPVRLPWVGLRGFLV